MELAIVDVVVFVGFLAAVVTIGLLASRHEKDSEAYFLAGRGLNWCLIGFSLIAANISAEQFVGMSGQAAMGSVGLAIASYEWIAAITLVAVAFFFLPKFLRSGIYTIPEYLEYRYTHTARTLMSLLMVIIYVGVNIATVIYLGAKAFQPFFAGLDIPVLGELDIAELSVIIGVVAAVYVAAGGLRACAWADLIQGSALILGGAVILVLVLMALDHPERYEEIDAAQVHASLDVQPDATLGEKLRVVKRNSMHMVKEADNAVIPWTALLLGIWIPNFYYWGLNQYIMQRSLAARSLSQGQMGVVFAAALKLIIPFVVCVPGILAFTLYSPKMQENAMNDSRLNGDVLLSFREQQASPAEAHKVFPFNDDFAALHPELAREVFLFNVAVAGVQVPPDASIDQVCEQATRYFADKDREFAEELAELKKEAGKYAKKPAKPSLKQLNDEAVLLSSGGRLNTAMRMLRWLRGERPQAEKQQELIGYDYDGAFPQHPGLDAQCRFDHLHHGPVPRVCRSRGHTATAGVGWSAVCPGVCGDRLPDRPPVGQPEVQRRLFLHSGISGLYFARRVDHLPVRYVRALDPASGGRVGPGTEPAGLRLPAPVLQRHGVLEPHGDHRGLALRGAGRDDARGTAQTARDPAGAAGIRPARLARGRGVRRGGDLCHRGTVSALLVGQNV